MEKKGGREREEEFPRTIFIENNKRERHTHPVNVLELEFLTEMRPLCPTGRGLAPDRQEASLAGCHGAVQQHAFISTRWSTAMRFVFTIL